jgi:hypothetical protein
MSHSSYGPPEVRGPRIALFACHGDLLTCDWKSVQLDESPSGHVEGDSLSEPVQFGSHEDANCALLRPLGVHGDDVLEGLVVQSAHHCLESGKVEGKAITVTTAEGQGEAVPEPNNSNTQHTVA